MKGNFFRFKKLYTLTVFAGIFTFLACENPYVIHNLRRQVEAATLEFHAQIYPKEKNPDLDGPYALKPVFLRSVMNYDVYVHENSEKVIPAATPETGSTIEFESGSFSRDGQAVTVPFSEGGYLFPMDIPQMEISFKVFKDYRLDGVYTIRIIRRPDPGRLTDIKISSAFFDSTVPGAGDSADPNAPGWIWETDNHMKNFDPSGTGFEVTLPYNAEKVILEPSLDPGVRIAYTLYQRNPDYFPTPEAEIEYDKTDIPQYFDFTGRGVPGLSRPYLNLSPPQYKETISGKQRSVCYLVIRTMALNPISLEPMHPQNYKLKLVWDEAYAYLKELDIRDIKSDPGSPSVEITSPNNRIEGTFFMGNRLYDAEVDADAEKLVVQVRPRDSGSTVTFEQRTAMDGVLDPDQGADPGAPSGYYSRSYAFPGNPVLKQGTTVKIIVENHNPPAFTTENNWGQYIYWINIRRAQPFASLKNLLIEGYAANVWQRLFYYDADNNGSGPDVFIVPPPPQSPLSELNSVSPLDSSIPESIISFSIETVNNFVFNIDGSKISKLRIKGFKKNDNQTVFYKKGNDPEVEDTALQDGKHEFIFNGSTGAAITVSETGFKDKRYDFSFVRAGSNPIEPWTDMREPPESGASPVTAGPSDPKTINDTTRGSFQALVVDPAFGERPITNALPESRIILRISPKLGWAFDKLYFIDESTAMPIYKEFDLWTYCRTTTHAVGNTNVYECEFEMPSDTVKFLLTYKYAAGKMYKAAYAAPDNSAARTGAYKSGADNRTGTSWAYATSNLQGLINAFGKPGSDFEEIWLLEGTYRLDPPGGASTSDDWWADAIPASGRDADGLGRSFVLKDGLRIYGGFKGAEGSSVAEAGQTAAVLAAARRQRGGAFNYDDFTNADNINQAKAAAQGTILSGRLRSGRQARHVVVAANIASIADPGPALDSGTDGTGDNPGTGYKFNPVHNADGVYGGAGVTLLDTLTIRDGLRTKDNGSYKIGNSAVFNRHGAGIYNVNASPILRNVKISDSSAVWGGGMYNAENGKPVLKYVNFENNSVTGYNNESGNGAGFASTSGEPVILDCIFSNNHTVGGDGAGAHVAGGKVLIRRTYFRDNKAANGGGLSNFGETWAYDSVFSKNDAVGGGSAIYQGGTLRLVNVTVRENEPGAAVYNTGIFAATNLTVRNNKSTGIANNGRLALVNSRLYDNNGDGLYISGGASVLNNVVIDGNANGLSYGLAQEAKSGNPTDNPALSGVILTNVTVKGNRSNGISAYYSSSHDFHTGAANLLLNSVRISGNSGAGLNLSYGSQYPDGRKGLFVTLNNVTIASNSGKGIAANTNNWVTAESKTSANAGYKYSVYDVLDLRIRNSVILKNGAGNMDTAGRGTLGAIGGGVSGTLSVTNPNTIVLNPDRSAPLRPGDTFRIAAGGPDGALKPSVNVVSETSSDPDYKNSKFTFEANSPDSYAENDHLVLVGGYRTNIGKPLSFSGGPAAGGGSAYTMTVSPEQMVPLVPNAMFKLSNSTTGEAASSPTYNLTYKITGINTNTVTFKALGSGSQILATTDYIYLYSERQSLGPIGARLKLSPAPNNVWTLPSQAAVLREVYDSALLSKAFRIVSGTGANERLLPSVNAISGVSGGSVTFTADSADAFAEADRILADLGQSGSGSGNLSVTRNVWSLNAAQYGLLTNSADRQFRLVDTGDTLRSVTNTVLSNAIAFTTTGGSHSYIAADTIAIDIGAVNDGGTNAGKLTLGANTWTLTSAQIAMFTRMQAAGLPLPWTFRIVSGGTARPSVNKVNAVTDIDTNTGKITFSADSEDTCADADRILLVCGEIGAANSAFSPLKTGTGNPNAWQLTATQYKMLEPTTEFKILNTGGSLGNSVNTVLGNTIVFDTAGSDLAYANTDSIMLVTDGTIGGSNTNGNLTAGSNKYLSLDPDLPLSSLLTSGRKFEIASRSADGTFTVKGSTNTVNSVSGGMVTFDAGAAVNFYPTDFIVFEDGPPDVYAGLKGNLTWQASMAGVPPDVVTKALIAGLPPALGGLITNGDLSGDYRPGGGLVNGGASGLYPASVADLADQCFERVDLKYPGKSGSNGPSGSGSGLRSIMYDLLNNYLFAWSGGWTSSGDPDPGSDPLGWPSPGGVLSPLIMVSDFLDKDNGNNAGDLRAAYSQPDGTGRPRAGGKDAGAYAD